MEEYSPGQFKDLFDSQMGQSIWDYLNSEEAIDYLQSAAQIGQPVEDVMIEQLTAELEEPMKEDDYAAISHMVNYIMVKLGYILIEQKPYTYRQQKLVKSRYLMTKYYHNSLDSSTIRRTQAFKPIKTWLQKKDTNKAIFDLFLAPHLVCEITGKAVFEDFDTIEGDPQVDRSMLESGSSYTIISDLSTGEIYLRLKIFFNHLLHRCLGRSSQEQKLILFGNTRVQGWKSGAIENSKAYIRSMPLFPDEATIADLSEKICAGLLDYSFHAKDEYGIKMNQYARALQKRIN